MNCVIKGSSPRRRSQRLQKRDFEGTNKASGITAFKIGFNECKNDLKNNMFLKVICYLYLPLYTSICKI